MHQSQSDGKLLKNRRMSLKSNRNEEEFEHSRPSIEFLTERIRQILASKFGIDNPWFIDSPDWFHKIPAASEDEPVDIVLFGSFIQRFFETGNLIHNNYRFWTISNQVKKVYVNLLGFPEDSITVIPRNEICPPGEIDALPENDFDLVYSGRIGPVKNIEFYLLFCYFLQKDHSLNVRPVLFGDFDDITHDHYGRQLTKDYRKFINDLCSSLDWSIKPEFMGLYPREEWIKNKKLNAPVFCSFSTYSKEDFGVSLGQAESEGWPSIVSAWGGHLDNQLENSLKIPLNRIGESTDELPIIEGKAKSLAKDFFENKKAFILKQPVESFQLPAPLSLTQLDQCRRAAVKRWGIETLYITRQMTEHFADRKSGIQFFNEFRKNFGILENTKKNILVLHDYNLQLYEKNPKSFEKINELAFKHSNTNSHLDVIIGREIGYKTTLEKLLKAESIFLLNNDESSKLLVKNLEKIIGPEKIHFLNS